MLASFLLQSSWCSAADRSCQALNESKPTCCGRLSHVILKLSWRTLLQKSRHCNRRSISSKPAMCCSDRAQIWSCKIRWLSFASALFLYPGRSSSGCPIHSSSSVDECCSKSDVGCTTPALHPNTVLTYGTVALCHTMLQHV